MEHICVLGALPLNKVLYPLATLQEASLVLELAKRIAKRYPVERSPKIQLIQQRLNDTLLLEDSKNSYHLRIYRPGLYSRRDIKSEAQIINSLSNLQPTFDVVPTKSGSLITSVKTQHGMRYALLTTSTGGEHPDLTINDHAEKFGETVAKFHIALDRQQHPNRPPLSFDRLAKQPLSALKPLFINRAKDHDWLMSLNNTLEHETRRVRELKEKPYFGLCHGDLHSENLHRDASGNWILLDFELCGPGWRAYDLAVYHWQLSGKLATGLIATKTYEFCWNHFLSGYNKVRTLNEQELKSIPPFTLIRHLYVMGLQALISHESTTSWIEPMISFARDYSERNLGC